MTVGATRSQAYEEASQRGITHQRHCAFCALLATNSTETFRHVLLAADRPDLASRSQILYEDDRFVVAPDIAPLSRGHLLVIPKAHVPSFGALGMPTRRAGLRLMSELASWMAAAPNLSDGHVIFEHGTAPGAVGIDGKCAPTQHAHVHIVPVREADCAHACTNGWELFAEPIPDSIFEDLREINVDTHYLWWRTVRGGAVRPAPRGIPSQWARRRYVKWIGEGLGSEGSPWRSDWRDFSSIDAAAAGIDVAGLVDIAALPVRKISRAADAAAAQQPRGGS